MANTPIIIKKINELPAAGAVSGSDVLAIMQGDDTVQATVTDVVALVDLTPYAKLDSSNQPFTGAIEAPEVKVTSLTPTRIVYVDSDDSLTDSANLAFDGNRIITFGDTNSLASIGKSNTFTNGSAGSLGFMAGFNNTLNLTGTAADGCAVGIGNSVTMPTGVGAGCAIGRSNVSTTQGSSVGTNIGKSNVGAGVGIGSSCTTTGASVTSSTAAIGYNCSANQAGSVALGSLATANGSDFATAIGGQVTATGFATVAMGFYTFATASQASAIGFGLTANASNAAIMGHAPATYSITNSTADSLMVCYESTNFLLDANRITANKPVKLKNYTVGTLPTGQAGDTAYVTDATAPTYLGALTGGGAVVCPVFHNGTAWVSA